jgi:hypothetical protein
MFRFRRPCFIKHAEARMEAMDSSMDGPWDPVFLPSHGLSGVSSPGFYNVLYCCFRPRWDLVVLRSGTSVGTQWCPLPSPSPRLGRWSSGGHWIKAGSPLPATTFWPWRSLWQTAMFPDGTCTWRKASSCTCLSSWSGPGAFNTLATEAAKRESLSPMDTPRIQLVEFRTWIMEE